MNNIFLEVMADFSEDGPPVPNRGYTARLVDYALEVSRSVDFDFRGALFAAILFFGNYNLALATEIEE